MDDLDSFRRLQASATLHDIVSHSTIRRLAGSRLRTATERAERPYPISVVNGGGNSNDVTMPRSKRHAWNFLSYLQQQIDEVAINRPWSRIHAVDAGIFIVIPDIFRDYDLIAARDLQSELASASFLVKADDETSSWIYCAPEARSLCGHVLDPVKCGLELGKIRTNHILMCQPQFVDLPASNRNSD